MIVEKYRAIHQRSRKTSSDFLQSDAEKKLQISNIGRMKNIIRPSLRKTLYYVNDHIKKFQILSIGCLKNISNFFIGLGRISRILPISRGDSIPNFPKI